jgi:hypothetical protein
VILFLGLSSLTCGIVMESIVLALVSVPFCIGGGLLCMVETVCRRWLVRAAIARRLGPLPKGWALVSVEDGLTFSRIKVMPDDMGLIWIYPETRCLRIEGMSHRYQVHARDVVSISTRRAPGMVATAINYRVGDVELAMVVSETQNNMIEILAQTIGLRPRLFKRISRGLRMQ